MTPIERQVRRAQRRLGFQRFLGALAWTCTAALSVAAVLILIGRFWPLGVISWVWLAAVAALGLLAAWIWTVATGRDPLDAAVEIDRQFGLKERVSSAWTLSDTERESQAGQALLKDATRRVERINVAEGMRITPSRRLLFPLIPATIACLLIVLLGPAESSNSALAKAKEANVRKQVRKSTKELQRRLVQKQKKAEKQGLKEVKDILKLLQQDLKKFQQSAPADRKKALIKLNDLVKQLQERRDRAAGAEKLKNQLQQLKNLKQGPADQLTKALKQGDFDKAAKALEKLREQLSSDKLNEEQRRQLVRQLDQMAQKLAKMADAHQKMQQKMENEIKKLREAGQLGQASKLEEQLAKLRNQLPQMNMLDKLARQLKQCSKCCKEGNSGEAQEAMQQLADQLGELQQEMDQIAMLDEALDEMAQCRGQMCCPHCQGAGCQVCQGQQPMSGGLEAGHGHVPGGMRGEQQDVGFRDSQVRQKVGKGAMTIGGYLDGPNRKGRVGEVIHEQLEAAKHGQTDPLTDQQMPRKHRQHAREYLERLRTGE